MPSDLIVDVDHEYWLHESSGQIRHLVGCTNTLKGVGLVDARYYNDEAMLRGTAVHSLITRQLTGTGPLPRTSARPAPADKPLPSHSGFVRAAAKYLTDSRADVLHVEMPLADPDRLMGGTPDLLAYLQPKMLGGERFAVIDWKTGMPERWHAYQTAWYEHLARVNHLVEGLCDRIVVHLKDDGTYTIRTFKDRDDWKVADAARLVEQAKRAA